MVDDLAPFEQQRLLKHHADITSGPERHILAADADRAFICRQEIGEDLRTVVLPQPEARRGET